MTEKELIEATKKIGFDFSPKQLELLNSYYEYLVYYNSITNLTAITDKSEVYLKHFYDSICLIRSIDFSKYKNIIDVGTGAGFPGLVIKILYPHLELFLLDSNAKKTNFLESLCQKLNIDNVTIINQRSETFALKNVDKFDLVVARAVKQLDILVELCLPLVKVSGYFIAMKANIADEIQNSEEIIKLLGGNIQFIDNYELPYDKSIRNNIIIKKEKVNPKGYPRNYSSILKKPLKKNHN